MDLFRFFGGPQHPPRFFFNPLPLFFAFRDTYAPPIHYDLQDLLHSKKLLSFEKMKISANKAREWGWGGRGKALSGTILRAMSTQSDLVLHSSEPCVIGLNG